MTALINFFIRVRNLVVAEMPFWIGVVIAAVNTVVDRSPRGYALAVGIALLHFVVSPGFEQAALKAKVVDPQLVAAVEAALVARTNVATALASDSFNGSTTESGAEPAPPAP